MTVEDTALGWLPSADRSSLGVYLWSHTHTHTQRTSSLSYSRWSLSETNKLRTALKDIQKAQLSVSCLISGPDLAICGC